MKRFRKQRSMWLAAGAVACLSVAAASSGASADTIAYNVSGTQNNVPGFGLSGIEFTPTTNIAITQLGFTAISLGGGDSPHVSVWNASGGLTNLTSANEIYDTGNILSSVTNNQSANGGTIATVTYVSVGTPIQLTAGTPYFISAPAYWVPQFAPGNVSVTDPSVLGNVSYDYITGGWQNSWANSAYNFANLGTNSETAITTTADFQYVASAPEPASLGLIAVSSLGLLARHRRRSV
jgi:hypothetical protein